MTARPAWVSIEGVNGVGKSHFAALVGDQFPGSCRLLGELTDHADESVTGRIIGALLRPGRTFLRTGHPRTETLALLAAKVREYEEHADAEVDLVLEDRGVDTVVIYQGLILADDDSQAPDMADLQVLGRLWRPDPDRTILLVDDPDACLERFAARCGQPVSAPDQHLVRRAHRAYLDLADRQPHRIRAIDCRGRGTSEILTEMIGICRDAVREVRSA